MTDLQDIKKAIFANGFIDAEDIVLLRENINEATGVSKETADFLFELKDTISKSKITKELEDFFVDSISFFLLEDEDSPGEIDESEAKWLRAKIQSKGYLDKLDKKLITNLRKKSINFPQILNFKYKPVRIFEGFLFGLRFVTFFAVIGSMMASIILFVTSSIQVYKGVLEFFHKFGHFENGSIEHLVATFVASIDGYLFATVLIIFSMGIYELFINKIDPVNKALDSRPSWLKINSIDDLKSSLGKVILMILIVSFFEHSLNVHYETVSDLLLFGVGILLISAALYLTHIGGSHKEHDKKEKSSK